MLKVIGGVPEGEFKAIASGSLPNGKPVVVNSDGTVSVAASSTPTAGTPVAVTDTAGNKNAAAYDAASQKVVLAWYDAGNADKGTAVVGTVSGETITFGTETVFEAGDTDDLYMIYEPDAQKVVIAYKDVGNGSYGTAVVGTVSGTSITFGTPVVFESGQSSEFSMSFDPVENSVLIVYKDVPNNQRGTAIAGQISGTSITFGTAVTFENNVVQQTTVSYDSNSGKHLIAYGETTNNSGRCRLAEITGTTVSVGAFTGFTDGNRSVWITSQPVGTGKVLLAFCDRDDDDRGKLCCASIDGSTLTFSDFVKFDEGDIVHIHSALNAATNEMIVVYGDEDTGNTHFGKFIVASVDGTTPTFTDPVTFESAYTERPAVAYDSNTKRAVVSYQDQGNSSFVTACVLNPATSNVTADNFIGMSRGVVEQTTVAQAAGTPVTYESAIVRYTSAAYDANSQKVVISYRDEGNLDYGTAVVGTVNASNNSISFGTPVVFESASVKFTSITYDANAQKVVIAYEDEGNSQYGTAIVGTVSGTSISFGTATVFKSSSVAEITSTYDSTNNKVVIAYAVSSAQSQAIVGTVSGTSISFGTATGYESTGFADYNSIAYDANAGKVVIAYRNGGAGNLYGRAVVGTVSGTSISFGSPVTYNAAATEYMSTTYDSANQKIVIAYQNNTTSYGMGIVGTVSGTSISFGTAATFSTASSQYNVATYDANAQRIVISFRGTSLYGNVVAGEVDGTSITFNTPTVFQSSRSQDMGTAYDSNSEKVVTSFWDHAASTGDAVVLQAGYTATDRYPVADGDPARMDITGSVSNNQLSLTAGSKYYVQSDGTISTTSSSVLAGTAISATKLLVKT